MTPEGEPTGTLHHRISHQTLCPHSPYGAFNSYAAQLRRICKYLSFYKLGTATNLQAHFPTVLETEPSDGGEPNITGQWYPYVLTMTWLYTSTNNHRRCMVTLAKNEKTTTHCRILQNSEASSARSARTKFCGVRNSLYSRVQNCPISEFWAIHNLASTSVFCANISHLTPSLLSFRQHFVAYFWDPFLIDAVLSYNFHWDAEKIVVLGNFL